MLPAIFVSHGAPTLPFDDVPARDFLRGLGTQLGRPRAVLAVSAHWDTDAPTTNAVATNDTIHDFYGFPRPLYDLRYAAPGDALLAREVSGLLSGFGAQTDTLRGLDHGAWVPLMLMYPDAGIPVVQLSVQSGRGAAHHIALGRALAHLREENVLVLGSGGFVHNLRQIAPPGSPEAPWSKDFAGWMHARLMEGDDAALADALHEGRIAAAGLDVFEGEPKVHPRLLSAPSVVLTPHIASATESTRRAMATLAADNLIAALGMGPNAGRPGNPINPEVLGRTRS